MLASAPKFRSFLSCRLLLNLMSRIDPATDLAAHAFLERVRVDVAKAILFGSRARGEPGKLLPTKLEMSDIAYDVLLDTGINVSPLPVWLSEWAHPEAYSNPRLLENIAREGVRL